MFGIKPIKRPEQWIWVPEENALINVGGYGRVQVVQVYDEETGENKYEGIVLVEPMGEVDVVIDEIGRFAFVNQDRHVVIPTEILNVIWGKGVPDIFAVDTGVPFIETPRGFNNVVLREAEEETQRKVELIAQIGNITQNTANCATSPKLFLAMATEFPSDRKQDPNEIIKEVIWKTPEEVRAHKTTCAFTNSALRQTRQFLLESDDPFLKDIGERM